MDKKILLTLWIGLVLPNCASVRSVLGVSDTGPSKPIGNPFADFQPGNPKNYGPPVILRTKKGDRAVELELPGDTQFLSNFVLPISPPLNDTPSGSESLAPPLNRSVSSFSDREITQSFPKEVTVESTKRLEIEQGLNLTPTDDQPTHDISYLAALDHIKQLYKLARFEAALLEVDDLIKKYQTDSKLHEMRGTLLDRMGRRELALNSWNQALRLGPQKESLRRFIERKQNSTSKGLP